MWDPSPSSASLLTFKHRVSRLGIYVKTVFAERTYSSGVSGDHMFRLRCTRYGNFVCKVVSGTQQAMMFLEIDKLKYNCPKSVIELSCVTSVFPYCVRYE
jgi:hypothetical protein